MQVPEGWEKTNLSDVLETLENGNRPRGGIKKIEEGVPSIGGEHLNADGGVNLENVKLIPRDFYRSLKRGKIKRRDVLVVKDGATTGKTSFVGMDFPYQESAVNEHVFILRGRDELIDQKFLFYHMFSPLGQRQIKASFHGSAVGGINTQFVNRYSLLLPPIDVQNKIVSILEKAEQLKQWRKESDKLTDDYLNSVFLKLFGDPKINPMKWDTHKMDEICNLIRDGEHKTPTYIKDGIPFVTAKNLIGDHVNLVDTKKISKEEHLIFSRRAKSQKGDILISKDGTIGVTKVIKTDKEFSIFVSVILLKLKKEIVNPDFLKYLLSTHAIQSEIRKRIRGIAIRHLHLVDTRNLKVPLPPLHLQQKFSKIVNQIENLRDYQKESKQNIDDLSNVLMKKAFAGELVC